MSPKRKKKASSKKSSPITTPASMFQFFYTEVFTILIPNSESELNLGVCVPCKKAKTRCRFVPGAMVCNRCQEKALSGCIIEPPKPHTRGTRSSSIDNLPSNSRSQTTSGITSNSIPGSSKQRKRSISDTSSQTNCPAKHPRPALDSSHSSHQTLNSIVEEDESLADSFGSDSEIAGFPEHNHARLTGKARFIDALAGSDDDEGSGGSDTGMEELEEDIDIDISSGDSSDGEDEDLSLSQPVKKRRLPSHSHIMKPVKTQSQSRGSTKPRRTKHEPNTYDPTKCCKWPNLISRI
jgi:hypothetical protein